MIKNNNFSKLTNTPHTHYYYCLRRSRIHHHHHKNVKNVDEILPIPSALQKY